MDRFALILGLLAAVSGCPPRVPVAPEGSHEGDMPTPVPYPPPAARAEVIPAQPHEDAVWVDGYWMWKGSDYSWSAGRWVRPGPGTVYSRATVLRLRNGELVFYPPKWHRAAK